MFKLANLIPIETHFKIMKRKRLFLALALAASLGSMAICAVRGFSMGIDFSGGVLVEIKTKGRADVERMRLDLAEFSPQIQSVGQSGDTVSIYLARGGKGEGAMLDDLNRLKSTLGPEVEYRNTQIIGPKVGRDLIESGIWAVVLSVLAISLYIGMRFEAPFAIGSLLSLSHDVIVALAMMSIAGIDFDLTSLAALLTLAGYSINDTVVIYDRVRENLRRAGTTPFADIIDRSINETFSRTILTGLTTIIALGAIYAWGGETLRGFSAIMLFGIAIGTWSSVFISTSALLQFKK
ncbi:MAG: protein translocase subunit SecF [Rickettsiales bacterium]|jgi:preprotein translocase SecF subunit|nr:protein translocase subunit SecF [Rickettsiales bacterium]